MAGLQRGGRGKVKKGPAAGLDFALRIAYLCSLCAFSTNTREFRGSENKDDIHIIWPGPKTYSNYVTRMMAQLSRFFVLVFVFWGFETSFGDKVISAGAENYYESK